MSGEPGTPNGRASSGSGIDTSESYTVVSVVDGSSREDLHTKHLSIVFLVVEQVLALIITVKSTGWNKRQIESAENEQKSR